MKKKMVRIEKMGAGWKLQAFGGTLTGWLTSREYLDVEWMGSDALMMYADARWSRGHEHADAVAKTKSWREMMVGGPGSKGWVEYFGEESE